MSWNCCRSRLLKESNINLFLIGCICFQINDVSHTSPMCMCSKMFLLFFCEKCACLYRILFGHVFIGYCLVMSLLSTHTVMVTIHKRTYCARTELLSTSVHVRITYCLIPVAIYLYGTILIWLICIIRLSLSKST